MRQVLGFIKTMIVGGMLFLFPLVIVTAIVGKAFKLMLSVTEPLDDVIPADSVGDVAVVNLVAGAALWGRAPGDLARLCCRDGGARESYVVMRGESSGDPSRSTGRRRWLWIVATLALLVGVWHLVTDPYREEEKGLRTRLREAVKEKFPEEAAEFSRSFGLVPFEPEAPVGSRAASSRGTVVLVHGLDDPGKVWRSLAPQLHEQGLDVWLMKYPNDQPIAESAGLLFEELKGLRERGVGRISIVAHSMGGLVSREMLTRPDVPYAEAAREGTVPEVAALIMVGTPNHGSPVARFRALAEARDQIARVEKGEASWLGGILDGAGEAKIDLLPESRFLAELNGRPHPEGVEMLIISGVASPWGEGEIDEWIDGLREDADEDQTKRLDELADNLLSMTRGLGDGLVSVESTRLEGVEHLTVEGTHLSMIRNIRKDSPRVPPAVPIIVDRLVARGPTPGSDPQGAS